jgi:hypothetical protein
MSYEAIKAKLQRIFPDHSIFNGTSILDISSRAKAKMALKVIESLHTRPKALMVVLRTPESAHVFDTNDVHPPIDIMIYHLDDYYSFKSIDTIREARFAGLADRETIQPIECGICMEEVQFLSPCESCSYMLCVECSIKMTNSNTQSFTCPVCKKDRTLVNFYKSFESVCPDCPRTLLEKLKNDPRGMKFITELMMYRTTGDKGQMIQMFERSFC